MKWRFSGRFFVYDSGEEGKCGQGKENQSQQGRRDAKTGRMDGNRRERMTEWEEEKRKRGSRGLEKRETGFGKEGDGNWKRGRRGLEKRKSGIGKEGEEDGHRAAYSLKQEGTICLQFCCVISKKAVGTE